VTSLRELAQHEPSARRGFTVVGDHITEVGPVVVPVNGSAESYRALRAAAEVAMARSCGVVVLEHEGSSAFPGLEERERATALSILRNSNVTVMAAILEDIELLTRRCHELRASMLVLSQVDFRSVETDQALVARLAGESFDLLLVAD
jgi:hypothetical protein